MEEPQFKELSQMLATESLTPEQRQMLARQLQPSAPLSNSSGDAAPVTPTPAPPSHGLCNDRGCQPCQAVVKQVYQTGQVKAVEKLLAIPEIKAAYDEHLFLEQLAKELN